MATRTVTTCAARVDFARGRLVAWFSWLVLLFAANDAWAIPRDFSIVTNQSSITLSGTVDSAFGSAPIQAQGSGTIKTDLFASGISFLSGSTIDANENGSWKPLADASDGSAPADYGAKATFLLFITVNFAGRNLVAGLTSGILPISSDQFDLSTTSVTFASGDLAYRSSTGTPAGSGSIAGKSDFLSGTGTLQSQIQGTQTADTLTLPINSDFVIQPDASTTVNLHLAGQLVATSTFVTPLWGDYNQNGVVDAADYGLWRKSLGSGASLPNDDTPGVGEDDFTRWRAHFGQTGSGSGIGTLNGGNVPEASSFVLSMIALCVCGVCRRCW
jgi:hypothetical protein